MNFSIAISNCPNDTFIVDHLLHTSKQDVFKFQVDYFDIQELNEIALSNRYDMIKVSFAMLPQLKHNYSLLKTGAALGIGNGPLLIAKNKIEMQDIASAKVLSPGKNTTANLLFNHFFPQHRNIIFSLFSDIEKKIITGEADAGIIIHESRFTFEKNGLLKIADLGEMWENETRLPIPLGCFVVRKTMQQKQQLLLQQLLQLSIRASQEKLPHISRYIRQHAQEMQDDIIRQHIALYVNEYTHDLNDEAMKAIWKLLNNNL